MSDQLSIRPVTGSAEKKIFIHFPWTVYKDDPHWIPPLASMRRERLDPRKNPILKHLEVEYFIAWRDDQPVGTIAAFINNRHNEYHGENVGWFGFFEALDDREVAFALLKTAEDWVSARGKDAIRGPASFGDLDEFGLQVDGFGPPHVLLMPYNPMYYMSYIEEAGFSGVMDTLSYHMTKEDVLGPSANPKIKRIIDKQMKRRNITLRLPDMKNLDREVELMLELYTEAWKDNWGFVPPTYEELAALVKQLKMFFHPSMARIAEIDGKPIGFMLVFPDLNQAFQYARPHPRIPEIITLLKFVWHWKIRRKVRRVRVPFLGVLEAYRGMSIDAILYISIAESVVAMGYEEGDFGWVLDDNEAMEQLALVVKGQPYKRFRIYQKPISAAE